ncbi:MAG: MFS transporter [Bacteroidota bacterium]
MTELKQNIKTKFQDIFSYSFGEGMNSLVMNSIFGFAMLYYTEALGLSYALAGIAMAIATFWDALTDPLMAFISDNTRSRYGRRHPYMLLGGILTLLAYYFIWAVPESFQTDTQIIFWYLVIINLLFRTSITIFAVSYFALGFEVCTTYDERAKLQGVKFVLNMVVNLLGPALAWSLFFKDPVDGTKATSIASNYVDMATAFTIVSLGFVLIVVFATKKYIVDSRQSTEISEFKFSLLISYFRDIFSDKYSRIVFLFMSIVYIGLVLYSSMQMYVYVYFMEFSATYKSIVHGSTMVGFGIGSAIMPWLVKKWEKKPVVVFAAIWSAVVNFILILIFVTGFLPKDLVYSLSGFEIPVSMLVFMIFHASYWWSNGILVPVAFSMLADLSEVGEYRTGTLKDGGYGATMSFVTKVAKSVGLLLTGLSMSLVGFVEGSETQSPEAINNLGAATFVLGAVIALIAMLTMLKYPIDRKFIAKVKEALAARERGEEIKLDI